MRPRSGTDLRRSITRQAWLANRARNALHRPAFIGAISIATFVLAIVSMVVVPRSMARQQVVVPTTPRPDTLSLLAELGGARLKVMQADSALGAVRTQALAAAHRRIADSIAAARILDSLGAAPQVARDSLRERLGAIDRLLARAEQAPLPASYRALAEVRELQSDPTVRALVDSLNDIEREREGFGAVGGVDPIFVALTTRANEIGRAIVTIAAERRAAVASELATVSAPVATVAESPVVDTLPFFATKDSATAAMRVIEAELDRRRDRAVALDRVEQQARDKANAIAPPLALLAAAFVLAAVIGFGTAFFRELRTPRIATAHELERYLGVRVLSTVERTAPSAERGRRQADRAAPPYFDPGAEGYQLAYLALATDHPALLTVTVTGDDPGIAAIVACNLAAVAADEARNTLVIDLDPRANASAALRARVSPGASDVAAGDSQWPDVTIQARVGRDKYVDLIPRGTTMPKAADVVALLKRDHARISRYYDAFVVLSSPDLVPEGLPGALPSRELVYCAQPSVTPLKGLRAELERLRAAGADIRGVVLWEAEHPILPTPRELAERGRGAERPVERVGA